MDCHKVFAVGKVVVFREMIWKDDNSGPDLRYRS
jgi:hypothetical protein